MCGETLLIQIKTNVFAQPFLSKAPKVSTDRIVTVKYYVEEVHTHRIKIVAFSIFNLQNSSSMILQTTTKKFTRFYETLFCHAKRCTYF